MCGIAGQVMADRRPVGRAEIEAMGQALRHRGPDDDGVYLNGSVGLAHRRLSVLDLSRAGHQPMSNDTGTVWIVFNGEIYNFVELRESLSSRYTFRSHTDTEVLLHLYEEHGLRCLPMLRGMFAFAIWDEAEQRLVLARDRIGKKPLFYTTEDGKIAFASELKALLAGGSTPDVDPVALHHYLTFQYVPTPRTIFRGIRKLAPGHVLVYQHGKVSDSAYWRLRYQPKMVRRDEREYREEFLSLFRESVRIRLTSDVPLGAFLSGGMDSSSVVAMMSDLLPKPVETFSIGFKDEAFNELPYAAEVARRFGTVHHEFVVAPSVLDILPTLVGVYDEPFADSSAIPTYYVSELSRRFVTVALNGDGGDELLGGYPRYQFRQVEHLLEAVYALATDPKMARDRVQRLIRWLPSTTTGLGRLRSSLERLNDPFSRTYLGRICYFSAADKDGLYTDGFKERVREQDSFALLQTWFDEAETPAVLDQLLSVDTRSYLPDDLLVKVDRATMAHGLEARSPLLDHRLLEFAAALPTNLKVRNGQSKYLLKAVMRGMLPDTIIERDKMGFAVPIDRWFREDCRGFIRDILLSDRSVGRGYFRTEWVRELIDRHQQGITNDGYRLYALLMLELWHRQYVDAGHSCHADHG